MSEEIAIHGYPNGGARGSKPRKPLVHMLAVENGDVKSISFHPDYADRVVSSILKVAKAAKTGRKVKTIVIKVSDT